MPLNKWNAKKADAAKGLGELVYRSNLLGSDPSVVNWSGGNTSMKTTERDFRGRQVPVLWVKGSGCDLASMGPENFTGLCQDDVLPLMEREHMSDEDMVAYLNQCKLDGAHPRMSIETLLHAFLPFKHVDHTHPDAIIALCTSTGGRQAAEEIYGDRFVWVPYIRPGFDLSKMIADAVAANPKAELVLMGKHGLVTWGETSRECYRKTIDIIQEAEDYIAERVAAPAARFGGAKVKMLPADERRSIAVDIMPVIRGAVSENQKMLLHFDDSEYLLRFASSKDAPRLSQVGAACPDHLVTTKRTPLYIDWDPSAEDAGALNAKIKEGVGQFKAEYRACFERNCVEGDLMADASPRIILIPGVGLIATGKTKRLAEVSAGLYLRAVAVMTGATALGEFESLNEKESHDVEYWPLELYKLSLAPAEVEYSRNIAFITGAAGGIGSATARRLAGEGAHVVVTDIDGEGARTVAEEINSSYGAGRAIALQMDVTDEDGIRDTFRKVVLHFGGLDVLVNNAGLATAGPFDETTLDDWNLNMSVLATGYFLVAREAFRLMKHQGCGGAMVFVVSKNAIYAGQGSSAYSTAKAAELHLARCIAAEAGQYGIRVNVVHPDAVLQGCRAWKKNGWREARARAYGIHVDELENYYRERTTLKVNILPTDIAEAISFMASSRAAKTTGCMITVDGGVAAAFSR